MQGHVGLPPHNGSCRAELGEHAGIFGGPVVAMLRIAPRARPTGPVDGVLHGDREAVERSTRATPYSCIVGRAGLGASGVDLLVNDRVECRIVALILGKARVEKLDC